MAPQCRSAEVHGPAPAAITAAPHRGDRTTAQVGVKPASTSIAAARMARARGDRTCSAPGRAGAQQATGGELRDAASVAAITTTAAPSQLVSRPSSDHSRAARDTSARIARPSPPARRIAPPAPRATRHTAPPSHERRRCSAEQTARAGAAMQAADDRRPAFGHCGTGPANGPCNGQSATEGAGSPPRDPACGPVPRAGAAGSPAEGRARCKDRHRTRRG